MSPERAMQTFMHKLSPFEHHEIFQFPQIYFVGQNAKKKQGVQGGAQNGGYDDEQGSYQLVDFAADAVDSDLRLRERLGHL